MVIEKQPSQILTQGGGSYKGVLKLAGTSFQVSVKYSEISYLRGNWQMLQLGYINFLFFRELVNQLTTIVVNSRPSKIICLIKWVLVN